VSRIEPSGYYYPNRIARIYIEAMEEVMGKNGLNAVLRLAGLPHLIDNYPPPNLAKEFEFADYSALNGALEEMYGPRGGRGCGERTVRGRATLAQRWSQVQGRRDRMCGHGAFDLYVRHLQRAD